MPETDAAPSRADRSQPARSRGQGFGVARGHAVQVHPGHQPALLVDDGEVGRPGAVVHQEQQTGGGGGEGAFAALDTSTLTRPGMGGGGRVKTRSQAGADGCVFITY